TVTFQHMKLGHVLYPGREHTGKLVVADIGIPQSLLPRIDARAELVEDDVADLALPPRRADTHKGTYGHVVAIAGVPDRPGSALLAGRAAMRTGAGLVTIASDDDTIARIAPVLEEMMGVSTGKGAIAADRALAVLEGKSAFVIGPSLDGNVATKSL